MATVRFNKSTANTVDLLKLVMARSVVDYSQRASQQDRGQKKDKLRRVKFPRVLLLFSVSNAEILFLIRRVERGWGIGEQGNKRGFSHDNKCFEIFVYKVLSTLNDNVLILNIIKYIWCIITFCTHVVLDNFSNAPRESNSHRTVPLSSGANNLQVKTIQTAPDTLRPGRGGAKKPRRSKITKNDMCPKGYHA